MDIVSHYLFVYSSLLKGFNTPEYEYVSRYFDLVGNGRTRGILSDKGGILVGTPVAEDRYIHGELYKIKFPNLFSFAIGQLDDYEGVNPEKDGPPAQYKRDLTTVNLPSGQNVVSWIYWYAQSIEGLPVVESGNVLNYLKTRGLM